MMTDYNQSSSGFSKGLGVKLNYRLCIGTILKFSQKLAVQNNISVYRQIVDIFLTSFAKSSSLSDFDPRPGRYSRMSF